MKLYVCQGVRKTGNQFVFTKFLVVCVETGGKPVAFIDFQIGGWPSSFLESVDQVELILIVISGGRTGHHRDHHLFGFPS